MVDTAPSQTNGTTNGTARTAARRGGRANAEWQPQDRRDLIPVLGFKEYWYPALPVEMVGKKPRPWRMLGEDLVFYQAKEKGQVACVSAICPHRGGNLAEGECHWRGTISCPYHGWTYDEEGRLVACISEGPGSLVPPTGIRARVYPTQVLKGMVFVWMGEGEPAPIEEDLPPEFFMPEAMVRFHIDYWPCNWRRSIENAADAHAQYVHRNSIRQGKNPMMFSTTHPSRYKIVNGRYALMQGLPPSAPRPLSGKIQHSFPLMDPQNKWPKSRWRRLWTWMFEWAQKRSRRKGPICTVEEWSGVGQHLPATVRRDENEFVFTRVSVPVDEELCREVYYHWSRASSFLGRVWELLHWHLYGNWSFNINFSQQDLKAVNNQKYDSEENFGPNDMTLVMWRRLCTMARDHQRKAAPGAAAEGAPAPEPVVARE